VTLTIERFVTRGKVSRRPNVGGALIDRVARERFAAECGRQLSRPWSLELGVVRIRRLWIRVAISPEQLKPEALTAAWVAAFIRELFKALAYPDGVEIVRFESKAMYLAAAIRDLVIGSVAQRWEYEEFKRFFNYGAAETVLALLGELPSEIIPTFWNLESWGLFDRVFALWDEVALDRLFILIGSESGVQNDKLVMEDLITVGRLLLSGGFTSIPIGSSRPTHLGERKLALKLFLRLARESDWRNKRPISPRTISHCLGIFDALLHLQSVTMTAEWRSKLFGHTLSEPASRTRDSILSGLINKIRQAIAATIGESPTVFADLLDGLLSVESSSTYRHQITEFWNIIAKENGASRTAFTEVLEQLVRATGSTGGQPQIDEFRLVSSDCAGLFLLIRILDKLNWTNRLNRSALRAVHGPRLLNYTLTGLALAMLNRFSEDPKQLDPGMTLFCGWMDEPDLAGLGRFFASESFEARRDLLRDLLGDQVTEESLENWKASFDLLGAQVIREFSGRVRGFGRASRPFVVKNFLVLPGRIRVEETRLVVLLAASPFNVVLHLSGMDDPVETVSWIGGRRVEFQLHGL
jgi:hypothetical protein